MIKELFKFRKLNVQKVKDYGFKRVGDKYQFETPILNEQFKLFVYITDSEEISTKVIDSQSQDEYILHLMRDSNGEFVGKVRSEFERVLTDIRDHCFEKEVFKSHQAKQVIEHIRTKYGDELEFLWEKFDDNAIWRRKDTKKWYALLVRIARNKLGFESKEIIDILDIRVKPDKLESLLNQRGFVKAYHMNKKSWITICLDDSVSMSQIEELIDESYLMATK